MRSTRRPATLAPRPLAADQDQRGPAVEIDPPFERKAAIGRDSGVGLGRQQAGQHDTRTGRGEPRERRGEALQRPQQDIGEDEIVGRAFVEFWSGDAVGFYHLDETAGAIERGIGAGRAHGAAVDVGCEHGPPQGAGRRDGEHARAGAEIENAWNHVRHPEVRAKRASKGDGRPTSFEACLWHAPQDDGEQGVACSLSCRCDQAPAGSRAWCRDGRCRKPAPLRSRCRCD